MDHGLLYAARVETNPNSVVELTAEHQEAGLILITARSVPGDVVSIADALARSRHL